MNRQEFMDYIVENYDISGDAFRLIANILCYAERFEGDEQYRFLCEMLGGTIGLSDMEIKKVSL